MKNKKAYFQGGGGANEPQKYKTDKAIVVQPRFKEPFYKNYDVYDVSGGKSGPGAGWNDMHNYKSVAEFLKARRKLKDKYKAEDSWIPATPGSKKKARINLLNRIIKQAIDFPLDANDASQSITEGSEGSSGAIGIGLLDKYLPEDDFEDKPATDLDYGRDYSALETTDIDVEKLETLIDKYINLSGHDELSTLPDGISLEDEDTMISDKNPFYGVTDTGTNIYDKV